MAESTTDAATPKPGHNGYDPDKAKTYFKAFEDEQAKIDKIYAEAKKKAEPYRAQQKEIKNGCKEKVGIAKTTFTHLIRERKLRAKLASIDADLNQDEADDADLVRHALGMPLGPETAETFADMPLGQAAVDTAPVPKGSYPGSFRDQNAKQEAKEAAASKAAQ